MIDRTKDLNNKQNIENLKMIKNVIEREIRGIEIGAKKQYTPKQLIKIFENLYNKVAYNIELFDKYYDEIKEKKLSCFDTCKHFGTSMCIYPERCKAYEMSIDELSIDELTKLLIKNKK
jgi:hypothetical protein